MFLYQIFAFAAAEPKCFNFNKGVINIKLHTLPIFHSKPHARFINKIYTRFFLSLYYDKLIMITFVGNYVTFFENWSYYIPLVSIL